MQIKLDDTGRVIGFTVVGGFEDGIEVSTPPPTDEPFSYRYENGAYSYDPLPEEQPEPDAPTLEDQIAELRRQNEMLMEQNTMMLECLLEMSELVYS